MRCNKTTRSTWWKARDKAAAPEWFGRGLWPVLLGSSLCLLFNPQPGEIPALERIAVCVSKSDNG
jgi:hypothetical protein